MNQQRLRCFMVLILFLSAAQDAFGAEGEKKNNTYLLTPWCRVLLEKLTGLQLVKNSPHFTEPEGSLPHSQASATCLCPGPAQSSPYTHIPPPGDPS